MLKDMYKSFVENASGLEGFKVGSKEDVEYDIDVLANGYVEARKNNDQLNMGRYISALMVRYWHMVPYLYESSKTLRIEMEDMVFWIYDALVKAFTYCSWLDESKPISKDKRGAEKCINQCITSVRQWWFKHLNQDKRKINAMTYSLNEPVNDDETCTLMDIQKSDDNITKSFVINDIIEHFINNGDIFSALIIDGIINQDTFRQKSVSVDFTEEDEEGNIVTSSRNIPTETFSSIMLSKHLRNLDSNFIKYFESNYDVSHDELEREVSRINSCTSVKLRKEIAKSLGDIKNNKEVLQLLCC